MRADVLNIELKRVLWAPVGTMLREVGGAQSKSMFGRISFCPENFDTRRNQQNVLVRPLSAGTLALDASCLQEHPNLAGTAVRPLTS